MEHTESDIAKLKQAIDLLMQAQDLVDAALGDSDVADMVRRDLRYVIADLENDIAFMRGCVDA